MLYDGVGVLPLVSHPQGMRESPRSICIGNITIWMETQKTNERQCDHGQWLEANVGQQYREGCDHLLRLNDVNSIDNNQP